MPSHLNKIAIIGAGFSGLTLAHFLKEHGDITLFEKSRGVSGRLSTRRALPYAFDHGAPYFCATTKLFTSFLEPFIKVGVIQRWKPKIICFSRSSKIKKYNQDNSPDFFLGTPAMNQLCKLMASTHTIKLNTPITKIRQKEKWVLSDSKSHLYQNFDWVISTAPAPQTEEMFSAHFKHDPIIKQITMEPKFVLLLGSSKKIDLPFDLIFVEKSIVSSIIINSSKPKRSEAFSMVVQSTSAFSKKHLHHETQDVQNLLLQETERILNEYSISYDSQCLHLWKYAQRSSRENYSNLVDHQKKIAACGDWCLGNDVEAAFTSAYNLSETLKKSLQ